MTQPKFRDKSSDGEHSQSNGIREGNESAGRRSGECGCDGRGVISRSDAVSSTDHSTRWARKSALSIICIIWRATSIDTDSIGRVDLRVKPSRTGKAIVDIQASRAS